ncbi:beta-N-acetylhexosaminidase [uncultured Cohaesibacter sp.]|uniref:beta-N-acetylhexosaminidase n=1 Tax=uncultured Cohaesibacter sp. TaxID=1002546 RepID=UPI0029C722C5|nr:beta-N-acetylhexosaminidase [uncultured Cohaesibacter sp.]
MARGTMQNPDLVLRSRWIDDASPTGRIELRLMAAPGTSFPASVRLAYTGLTRIPPKTELIGARYLARTANYHELAPLGPLTADDRGLLWQLTIPALSHKPNHCTDGPSSAFLILPDASPLEIVCELLQPDQKLARKLAEQTTIRASTIRPERKASAPTIGMLPLANNCAISDWQACAPVVLCLDEALQAAGEKINALHGRLFDGSLPFTLTAADKTECSISLLAGNENGLPEAGYRLVFSGAQISIAVGKRGLHHALIALAQIWRAARLDPDRFAFPAEGIIEDWPRHYWRGMHLDVSRQFYTAETIKAFLDCLAWHRLNHFHWHLSDDEGWRLESRIYPHLTEIGAWRGHGLALLPQHGSGASRYGGFYSQAQVRDILAHAESLDIEVVPEIDVPGHCHAAMMALPELIDPSAMAGGASVQGYVNNALNPGLGATWLFLEHIFGEVADLFPGRHVHMGGDEVAEQAWIGSRAAGSWARAKGHLDGDGRPDCMKMQAAMLRFVVDQLVAADKKPLAWQEAAKGGGVDPEKVILMAWMNAQSARDLAKEGYQVIMCPGEVYYLDMAQSSNWWEPGLSWAGTSSPEQTYRFDASASLGASKDQLVGIQGGIWSENLTSRARFNHMVFPRLSAIAESAWTASENKHWPSFTARQSLMPALPEDGDIR